MSCPHNEHAAARARARAPDLGTFLRILLLLWDFLSLGTASHSGSSIAAAASRRGPANGAAEGHANASAGAGGAAAPAPAATASCGRHAYAGASSTDANRRAAEATKLRTSADITGPARNPTRVFSRAPAMFAIALLWSLSLVPCAHVWLLSQVRAGDQAAVKMIQVCVRGAHAGAALLLSRHARTREPLSSGPFTRAPAPRGIELLRPYDPPFVGRCGHRGACTRVARAGV